MASLSLPRVLQLKKNSLDAEREQFEKFQTLAIQKAINAIETPVKEKHVRSTIIGTFQEQSAITYWMVAVRLPLQDNRIVAWKFCHVTHKLLREGHPACLDDSQRHITMIENLGKLWVHLREGYGRLVNLYCNLLVCKLKFHSRNPRFPGNMQLTADELDAIAENDVNNYFQLCVELFDYMDDILTLQASVFDSLGNARANSMTASGQCRLAALIPCAQDASHIYDCNVRLLFRLHASLPSDTLAGHRERFRQQFKKLSSFYKHASSLQYYRNLLTLPVLPANPPNFLQQSDFGTYVTPVVTIPDPQPDEVDAVGSLIDTSDTMSQMTPDHLEDLDTRPTPSPQPDPVVERDRLIDHLQNELKRMRSEVSQLVQERNTMLGSMREHCTRLEQQLNHTKSELEQEKQKAEVLSVQAPEIKKKLAETEDKAKVTDEKFQKLKGAYTQLREEHIALIRQKAEVDKMSAALRAATAQHESAKTALQQQLNDRIKDVELLQQSASSSEEIEAYKNEILSLRTDLEQARQKEVELETVRASMEALEIEHKTATVEQQDKMTTIANELKEATETLEKVKQEREEKEADLAKVREELVALKEKSGEEYKKVVEEKETALKQVNELTQQYLQEKQEQASYINSLQDNLESLQQKLIKTESIFAKQCEELNEKLAANNQELHNTLGTKDDETQKALNKLVELQQEIDDTKTSYNAQLEEKESEIICLQEKVNEMGELENNNEIYIMELTAELEDVKLRLDQVAEEKNKIETMLSEKDTEISEYNSKMEELKSRKDEEVANLNEELQAKLRTLDELNVMIRESSDLSSRQKSEVETLHQKIAELESIIDSKDKEIVELGSKLNAAISNLEQQNNYYQNQLKDNSYTIALSQDKLQNVAECKDEIINNLKSMVAEKDEQVISLNVQVTKYSEEAARLAEELLETKAELEIGMNELLTLRDEHDAIVDRNENNLILKNQELRDLHDEINKVNREKADIISEKQRLTNEFSIEKEVLVNNIKELTEMNSRLTLEYDSFKSEKEAVVNDEIIRLNAVIDDLKTETENKIDILTGKIQDEEANHFDEIAKKDKIIAESESNIAQLKAELDELKMTNLKEKEDMDTLVSERDSKMQILDARLGHIQSEKLNAECELQDLLQHNNILETDLAAAKIQLEEARQALEHKSSSLVQCASEAALELTQGALAALERANAQDTNRAAAELAAKAFMDLGSHINIKGNEETLAKSAISVAHSTAQLSAYITDLSNLSTDVELSNKLNSECRSMLSSTQQCLDALKRGVVDTALCAEGRVRVLGAAHTVAEADLHTGGARSVDDELADMDQAIALAAKQIEEMLAASRAGDSGVKLEVNGKILDACTTLMGAVKILVQDARRLQQELGDTSTRQKMYRKNPQWSEGLISAAKSVVFAAKLLVTSADEAVGSAGRAEGVSAAAHEVAGSTAQLVAASRARAPPAAPSLARLTQASRSVAAATGAVVAAVRAGSALVHDQEALDTSALSLTATRRLEMESKVRALELESALDAERARLAALRKRHYHLAQVHENGSITNGKE